MLHKIQEKIGWRRCKIAAAIALPLIVLGAMFYTGFASDIGLALLARLPMPMLGLSAAPEYTGPVSLEERIIEADVIARVKMRSVSQDVEAITYAGTEENGEWVEGSVYINSLEFGFEALEYLKGGGNDDLTAIVTDETVPYNTKLGARAFGRGLIETHDTAWDDREAILFLSKPPTLPSTESSDRYWLGWMSLQGGQVQEDAYTINSQSYKKWLPAAKSSGINASQSANALDDDVRRFLTGAIPAEGNSIDIVAQKTAENRLDNKSLGTGGDSSTITLSQLKELIADLEEEIAEGDGSEEYRQCVYEKYKWEREFRRGEQRRNNHELVSGMPAGTAFARHYHSSPDLRRLVDDPQASPGWEAWLEGEDAHLFQLGNLPIHSPIRPLPRGEYRYYYNYRDAKYISCDAYPEARRTWNIHTVKVIESAEDTLHEAFFDPVAFDGAVGADGESGVLQPEWFESEEGETVIERIAWSEGQVEMELSPATDLDDYRMDFIALDGSVALRLDFDSAVALADDVDVATLAWGVCSQPWSDGDLLMLRIAEDIPDDGIDATNDPECLDALPEQISAPAAVSTPEPTATPEVTPTETPVPTHTAIPTATPTPAP